MWSVVFPAVCQWNLSSFEHVKWENGHVCFTLGLFMHGNSSASTETKPALFGQKPFVVKAKRIEGEWSDSCVSLAVGAGHPKCLPELLFWGLKKSTGHTQSSPQCSQQTDPSGGCSWIPRADGEKQNSWGNLSWFNTSLGQGAQATAVHFTSFSIFSLFSWYIWELESCSSGEKGRLEIRKFNPKFSLPESRGVLWVAASTESSKAENGEES